MLLNLICNPHTYFVTPHLRSLHESLMYSISQCHSYMMRFYLMWMQGQLISTRRLSTTTLAAFLILDRGYTRVFETHHLRNWNFAVKQVFREKRHNLPGAVMHWFKMRWNCTSNFSFRVNVTPISKIGNWSSEWKFVVWLMFVQKLLSLPQYERTLQYNFKAGSFSKAQGTPSTLHDYAIESLKLVQHQVLQPSSRLKEKAELVKWPLNGWHWLWANNRRLPKEKQVRSKRSKKLLVVLSRKHCTHQAALCTQYVMRCEEGDDSLCGSSALNVKSGSICTAQRIPPRHHAKLEQVDFIYHLLTLKNLTLQRCGYLYKI